SRLGARWPAPSGSCPELSDPPGYRQPQDQQDQEDHDEDKEQRLGDGDRGSGNAGKAQKAGDQADHEENKGPTQHRKSPAKLVKEMPIRARSSRKPPFTPRPAANPGTGSWRAIAVGSSGGRANSRPGRPRCRTAPQAGRTQVRAGTSPPAPAR